MFFRVWGDKATEALQQMISCDLSALSDNYAIPAMMLDEEGGIVSILSVCKGKDSDYLLATTEKYSAPALEWFDKITDENFKFSDGSVISAPVCIESVDESAFADIDSVKNLLDDIGEISDVADANSKCSGIIDFEKLFFVGQSAVAKVIAGGQLETYTANLEELPVRKTVLNEVHKTLGGKMVPFAGWEMPVQYPSGIFAEHKAVRTAAGLFDVSHMGVFEVKGKDAGAFLNLVLSNNVAALKDGKAQYNYILNPDGKGLDDSFLYKFDDENFMLVVNAANAETDWAWFEAVLSGKYIIDNDVPSKKFKGDVTLRNLRDAGSDSLIDLAFQGPKSRDILLKLAGDDSKDAVSSVKMNSIAKASLKGIPVILTGTGYTGEDTGFEIYVHPDKAVELWNAILEAGKDEGALPIGLGARDSLRVEAGFPLFGHELEGKHGISITEAGYGFAVKYQVPFFIGKTPYRKSNVPRSRSVLRLHGKGKRSLRDGHIIINDNGEKIADVTSFAFLDEDKNFVVIALLGSAKKLDSGTKLKGYRASEAPGSGNIDDRKVVELEVMERFASPEEKGGWKEKYL